MTKFFIKFFWIIIIFSVIRFQPVSFSGNPDHSFNYLDYSDTSSSSETFKQIAIIGDLQRTSIWEMMLGREQNDSERELLIKSIKKDNPALLILLGDMVSDGSNLNSWEYFDSLLTPVKDIPVLPVMGNHDYSEANENSGYTYAKRRFKQLESTTWYTRKYGSMALIFLDSNENQLNTKAWNEQKKWFIKTLADYDNDIEVKSILVFTHHPPYTNSIVTGDEENIQDTFVKPFAASKKAAAFFSGHAHTYEHFKINGKDFFISGGGGGPRVFLKKGADCHKDECTLKGVRPFHYILLQPGEDSIGITVKGINKNETNFFMLDSVNIQLKNNLYSELNKQLSF